VLYRATAVNNCAAQFSSELPDRVAERIGTAAIAAGFCREVADDRERGRTRIVPTLGFHDLRRLNATEMVRLNVDIKTAQHRLGHSDPRLTLAVYAEATTEADVEAAGSVLDCSHGVPSRRGKGRKRFGRRPLVAGDRHARGLPLGA
jgi:hypothetical protein